MYWRFFSDFSLQLLTRCLALFSLHRHLERRMKVIMAQKTTMRKQSHKAMSLCKPTSKVMFPKRKTKMKKMSSFYLELVFISETAETKMLLSFYRFNYKG